MKMYKKTEVSEDCPSGVMSCDIDREQRTIMEGAGWTQNESGDTDSEVSAVLFPPVHRFICDECGAGYAEKPEICEAEGCESESFTDCLPPPVAEKADKAAKAAAKKAAAEKEKQ